MSISALSSSSLGMIEQELLAGQTSSTSATTPTTSAASTASATSADPTATATAQLTKDLATLLKDLASGNVTDSKSAIAKVQQDLKSQTSSDPTSASGPTSSSTSSGSPLDNLLTQIASSLNSTSSTSGSLQDLATYLIQNGQGTGNVVNTTA